MHAGFCSLFRTFPPPPEPTHPSGRSISSHTGRSPPLLPGGCRRLLPHPQRPAPARSASPSTASPSPTAAAQAPPPRSRAATSISASSSSSAAAAVCPQGQRRGRQHAGGGGRECQRQEEEGARAVGPAAARAAERHAAPAPDVQPPGPRGVQPLPGGVLGLTDARYGTHRLLDCTACLPACLLASAQSINQSTNLHVNVNVCVNEMHARDDVVPIFPPTSRGGRGRREHPGPSPQRGEPARALRQALRRAGPEPAR